MSRLEVISEESARELFREYKEEGSIKARNELIVGHLPLVKQVIRSGFSRVKFYKEELESVGRYGLVKSVDSYNPDKWKKAGIYFMYSIKSSIQTELKWAKIRRYTSLDEVPEQVSTSDEIEDLSNSELVKLMLGNLSPFEEIIIRSYYLKEFIFEDTSDPIIKSKIRRKAFQKMRKYAEELGLLVS